MLQGLAKYSDRINRPGLLKLQYAPIHWIDLSNAKQVINDQGVWIFPIPFSTSDWLEMKILPIEDGWQQNLVKNDQGPLYQESIQGFVPGLRKEASTETRNMATMRFIVKITDKNEQSWLVGSLEQGLDFTFSGDTGPSNGKSGLQISFSGAQRLEAPIYGPG